MDGEGVGRVPFEQPLKLAAGKHTLKISKPGYTEYFDVVRIRPGRVTDVEIDLLPVAGVLRVSANVEGARVFVDDRFVGLAPLQVETLIGMRRVLVRMAGFHQYSSKVRSVAGKVNRLRVQLRAKAVGTTPYRPVPPPPARWYEKWYVWAAIAGGVAAAALAISISVTSANRDPVAAFDADYRFRAAAR